MYNRLFSKLNIGKMTVPNRIVMTAMGNHLANPDGTVSEADLAFYGARARGGVGLVITECACVDFDTGKGNLRQLAADDDKHVEGLARLAREIHKYGSRIAVQLYHPGRQGIAALNQVDSMKSSSKTECQCVHQPTHEMSKAEIREMVEKFAEGAERLKKAGIDAVELHGAHGYLIGQFLSPYTNKRTDEYGGSFENRMRFLDEIIDAVRRACGPDYPIIVRYSVDEHMDYAGLPEEGLHLQDGIEIAVHLEDKGIDALDISAGIYETMNTAWEPVGFEQGWKAEGPAEVKKAVHIPVIGAAVIREPDFAEKLLEEKKMDFIGSARTFFADPEWARKTREGKEKEIRKCISCLYCMETLMQADTSSVAMGCAVNFEGCRETQYSSEKLKKDGNGRRVAVIGAGPSGMEAARILAKRGFCPVVFEKQEEPGGQIILAEKPPGKKKTGWLSQYLYGELKRHKVEMHFGQPADLEKLKMINPYAVFIAQGSLPALPKSIPGLDGEHVYTPDKILSGEVQLRGIRIAVIGSGMTGIETAEFLEAQGNNISVFEMEKEIGPGIFFQNLVDVMKRIQESGTALYPQHRLIRIEERTAIFEHTCTGEKLCYDFDAFVVSLGTRPNEEHVREIEQSFDRVVLLGDAGKPGRIEQAIRTGYLAAAELR